MNKMKYILTVESVFRLSLKFFILFLFLFLCLFTTLGTAERERERDTGGIITYYDIYDMHAGLNLHL